MVVLLLLRIAMPMDAGIGVVVPCCAGKELFLIECHHHLIAIFSCGSVVPIEPQVATAFKVRPMGTSLILTAHTAVKGEAVARGRLLGDVGHDVVVVAAGG